ncbi:MAG: SIS domain-containing protein [Clostridiales bacterium]|nr:SIS domain-containing protein [Clostridiales bacterium]
MDITLSTSYKETMGQYEALKQTFAYMAKERGRIVQAYKGSAHGAIVFSGSGSSFEVSRSSAISASLRLKEKSIVLAAGDILINHADYAPLLKGALLVLVSRSGATSEVILAAELVKKQGGKVFSVICTKDSPLAALSDVVLELPWAFDDSVCQTRTVTNLYTANLCLLAFICGGAMGEGLLRDISSVIERGEEYIQTWAKPIQEVSAGPWDHAIVLADGELEGIAQEGALAFKEICNARSNYHHVLDVRHGPMVGITEKTFVIISLSPNDDVYQRSLIRDIIKKGATVVVYSPEETAPINGVALQVFSGLPLISAASGIPFIFVPQMAALTHSAVLGNNPDKPHELDPWIKL